MPVKPFGNDFLFQGELSESESHSVTSDSLPPVDYTVYGLLQARVLEWVALRPVDYTVYGLLQDRVLEWVAFPFSSPGGFPKPGIKPRSPTLQADSLPAEP